MEISNIAKPANKNRDQILSEIKDYKSKGMLHILYLQYLKTIGFSQNMVLPHEEDGYKNYSNAKYIIILNNPKDVERIVFKHVKKTPYLTPLLYNSIISTTDETNWREQRQHYQPAFSVNSELKKLVPISNERATKSVDIMINLINNLECETEFIDIHDFFLNETLAQLQIAMFGLSDEFQENTNKPIRKAFSGINMEYAKDFAFSLLKEVENSNGPLSCPMRTDFGNRKQRYGNALIFTYAGHDTTANTLSWLIYEICKNSSVYDKLQSEVDTFWENNDQFAEKEIEYNDLKQLKYMTRCIMETLRLWTSIPNGTSRELIEDDYITGENGEKVFLPKGTFIQIPNWTRHRNPELWGADVNIFNPDRKFIDEEIWEDMGLNSYNPSTERFSPFTYGPRDCIGKNFSQIEMRIILLHLLKNFTFRLSDKQLNTYDQSTLSINGATLSPRSVYNNSLYEKKTGMYVYVLIRNFQSKL